MCPIAESSGDGPFVDFVMAVTRVAAFEAHGFHALPGLAPFSTQIPAVAGQIHHGCIFMPVAFVCIMTVLVVVMIMVVSVPTAVQMTAMGVAIAVHVARQTIFGTLTRIGRTQIAFITDP